ncbi:hypothetical protein BDFB_008247 [Asbolus verrucosus]|uniref:Uncharacterized protein n=1 Tax=Asbolus verrucosus TaxID=1661398 RepID=A0A482VPP6_ASBVE|nr:hypothetical protein BDFB_008247 [Asbolus verrucosus]
MAKLSEAKARALSNRAKIRATSARIKNHLVRAPGSPRTKRYASEDFDETVAEPPSFGEHDPVLLHVCSLEDDGDSSEKKAASNFPRSHSEPQTANNYHIIRTMSLPEENREMRMEEALDQAFAELMEARRALDKIEEENGREPEIESPQGHDLRGADADPHIHSGIHTHQHSIVHNPLFPSSNAQIAVPGFSLNINQNHQNVPLISHGSQISPLHGTLYQNHHNVPLISHNSGILPVHASTIIPQTHLRTSEGEVQSKDPEAESPLPELHQHHQFPVFPKGGVLDHLISHHDVDVNEGLKPQVPHIDTADIVTPFDQNQNQRSFREETEDSPPPSEEIQRESTFDPFNEKDDVMDFLSRHRFRETLPMHYVGDTSREASPTLHKKKKKFKFQPQYYPSYQTAYMRPNFYHNFNYYREAEDSPLAAPNLFNFPARRDTDFFQKKRSVDDQLDAILGKQRQIVDSLQKQSKNDEDLKLVADIGNRTVTELEQQRKRVSKRSIPLTRLISDPNIRLDVPQTIENFGTATRNAFEDERAPMYHLKHMVGSSKNALLSAMRIPPQNMIIPTDYEIVKSTDRVGAINPNLRSRSRQDPDDPLGFSHTFKRVGEMVRESIKSGQDTAAHISDIAHDAKNILHSARHSAPRLIIPYSQIPAIQDSRKRPPSKAILITPRILDLAQERSGKKSDSRPNFVRLGHLMDAVGISNPNAKNLDLQKIIFEPRRVSQAKVDERLAQLYSRFRDNFEDDDADTVGEALSTLEDAKISVGAKNLGDLLLRMKNELLRSNPEEPKKKKYKSKKKKKQETREMGTFIENLFDGSEEVKNETVGDSLYLSPELLHPFMGRASETQLHDFLRDNGNENKTPSDHYRMDHGGHHNDSNLGYVLGAINPLMFERMYNQTVQIKNDKNENQENLFGGRLQETNPEPTVGTIMALNGPMLKPFMGEVQPEAIEKFLDTYNGNENEIVEKDE